LNGPKKINQIAFPLFGFHDVPVPFIDGWQTIPELLP
jgi:hypothetical protein